MLSQRFTILPGGILGLLLFPGMTLYRRVCGQMLAQNLFDRARLASEFSEAQKERLGNQAAAHGEDCNRILLCCTLEDDGIEFIHFARELRQLA